MPPTKATVGLHPEPRPLSALTTQTTTSHSSNPSTNSIPNHPATREDVPTRPQTEAGATTTSAVENLSFSEHEDLLVLAQQHFDDLRRTLKRSAKMHGGDEQRSAIGTKSALRSTKNIDHTTKQHEQSNQLLSTLLYLSLMMNKVEEVKSILKQVNVDVYNEWSVLITVLHPPPYHMRERRMQTDLARRIYERKAYYKRQTELCGTQLGQQKDAMSKAQKQANDTVQQMSTTISNLLEAAASLRAQLSSKEHVEMELSQANREGELRRVKLVEAERQSEQIRAEMTVMIKCDQEALKATNAEQQNSKAEIARLMLYHEQALKDISDKAIQYKSQSKLLEEQLEQYKKILSELQDQANDTAQKMSASITHLMEETTSLRTQVSNKQQVELELSTTNRDVETLRSKLEETARVYEQTKAENEDMMRLNQQALKEANAKVICAYDRAANAETELLATKEALAVTQKQLYLSRSECAKDLSCTRDLINMHEKANKLESELVETTKVLAETHKDLNFAKGSLTKALEIHAQKSKNELKMEENLQQVTRACRYTSDLLNMMDAKLDGFQTSTKTATSALEHDLQYSNTVLDQVQDKVFVIESIARNITAVQDTSCTNFEKRFYQLDLGLDEISNKTKTIGSLQDMTVSIVGNIDSKTQDMACDLATTSQASNLALNQIRDKLANLDAATISIANTQDDSNKIIIDDLHKSGSYLKDIDGNMRSALLVQDSTAALVKSLQDTTGSLLTATETDSKEVNLALEKIHDKVFAVEACTKEIASVQSVANINMLNILNQVGDSLASIESSKAALYSLQDVAALPVTGVEHLGSSLDDKLLMANRCPESESQHLNGILDQIHGKLTSVDAKSNNISSAQEALNKKMAERFQQVSCSIETIDDNSMNVHIVQDSTATLLASSDAKTESLLAARVKDAQEVNLALELINGMFSNVVADTKIAASAQDLANSNLVENFGKLSSSVGCIETNTESILSLNDVTASSVSNLERMNSSLKEQVLSTAMSREKEVQQLNLVLNQIDDKVTSVNATTANLVLTQDAASDKTNESFQKISVTHEVINEVAKNVKTTEDGVDCFNAKTESLLDFQENDSQQVNPALEEIRRKVADMETHTKNVSSVEDVANATMAKSFEQFSSSLGCIEASTKVVGSLWDETALSVGIFERLNNSLNEQLVSTRTSQVKEVQQLNRTLDQIHGDVIKVNETASKISFAEDAVGNQTTKIFQQLTSTLEDINRVARSSTQWGKDRNADEVGSLNEINVDEINMNTTDVNIASFQDAVGNQMTKNFQRLSSPLESLDGETRNVLLEQDLMAVSVDRSDARTDSPVNAHENFVENAVTQISSNGETINGKRMDSLLDRNTGNDQIVGVDADNKLSFAAEAAESNEVNVAAEENNSAETSTWEDDKVGPSLQEMDSRRMSINFEQSNSNLDFSMITTCSLQDVTEFEHSEVIAPAGELLEVSSFEKQENDEVICSTREVECTDEQDDSVDSVAELVVVHATALVYVGIIQVEAIESALLKV